MNKGKYSYPPGCDTARFKRQYREGFRWGKHDAEKGKYFAIAGSIWQVEGYIAGNKSTNGTNIPVIPFES